MVRKKTDSVEKKKKASKPSKSNKKSKTKSKSSKKSTKSSDQVDDSAIVIVDDDLTIDKEKEIEERRAYLEEARSQEAFD